jgi:hypothetical protein
MPQEAFEESLRSEAESWVARFAPLIMTDAEPSPEVVRGRLDTIQDLRRDGGAIWMRLGSLRAPEDRELVSTFERAWKQLPSMEDDIRRALARVAPGHPESRVELDALRMRLEEREARQEIGLDTDDLLDDTEEIVTSPTNWLTGGSALVFGLGWNAFTLFHAVFMIGGMYQAFGPAALLLLLFYSIFFAVGFGMMATAYTNLAETSVTIQDGILRRTRRLWGMTFTKFWELEPGSVATLESPGWGMTQNREDAPPPKQITFTSRQGKPVQVGAPTSERKRDQVLAAVNRRLQADAHTAF